MTGRALSQKRSSQGSPLRSKARGTKSQGRSLAGFSGKKKPASKRGSSSISSPLGSSVNKSKKRVTSPGISLSQPKRAIHRKSALSQAPSRTQQQERDEQEIMEEVLRDYSLGVDVKTELRKSIAGGAMNMNFPSFTTLVQQQIIADIEHCMDSGRVNEIGVHLARLLPVVRLHVDFIYCWGRALFLSALAASRHHRGGLADDVSMTTSVALRFLRRFLTLASNRPRTDLALEIAAFYAKYFSFEDLLAFITPIIANEPYASDPRFHALVGFAKNLGQRPGSGDNDLRFAVINIDRGRTAAMAAAWISSQLQNITSSDDPKPLEQLLAICMLSRAARSRVLTQQRLGRDFRLDRLVLTLLHDTRLQSDLPLAKTREVAILVACRETDPSYVPASCSMVESMWNEGYLSTYEALEICVDALSPAVTYIESQAADEDAVAMIAAYAVFAARVLEAEIEQGLWTDPVELWTFCGGLELPESDTEEFQKLRDVLLGKKFKL
eukprot:Clim_evm60s144 gene=Clim_evmTU60s144